MILKVRNRDSPLQKLLGLHWHIDDTPIFFTTRLGIHTFGMRYEILCLVLDDQNVVVDQHHLKPNRVFFWNPRFSRVIEVPNPTIEHKQIVNGTRLQLDFS